MDTIFLRLMLDGFKFLKVELSWHHQGAGNLYVLLHNYLVIKEKKN